MKIRFNWGTGIFIVIVLFVFAVIAFFIFINTLDINLVEDNYYEKELAYQERIDKIENTAGLTGKIDVTHDNGQMIIRFPDIDSLLVPTGTVWFYRPSDPKKDFTVPLQLDNRIQVLDVSKIDPGKWTVKMEWEMGGKHYYFEETLIIEH